MCGVVIKSYPTFINMITSHTSLCSCRGVCGLVLNTFVASFYQTAKVFHLLHPLIKGLCSCRGICLNSTCTSFEHTCSFILRHHKCPSPFPSICWGWFFPLCWWFSSWDKGYFRSRSIYLCFDSFTTSFFWWPLRYGVWIFTKLFCPRWFCEWFWPLFQSMWAHCLRSCSTFSVVFVLCVLTPIIGEVV